MFAVVVLLFCHCDADDPDDVHDDDDNDDDAHDDDGAEPPPRPSAARRPAVAGQRVHLHVDDFGLLYHSYFHYSP